MKKSQYPEPVLSYTNQSLTEIPPNDLKNPKWKSIILESNRIHSLPDNLPSLVHLAIKRNLFIEHPDIKLPLIIPQNLVNSILTYSNLQVLDLSHNLLTDFPPQFSSLKSLKELHLSENRLTQFTIPQFPQLTTLNLSRNNFTSFPSNVLDENSADPSLITTNIAHFSLSFNDISSITGDDLKYLRYIQRLSLTLVGLQSLTFVSSEKKILLFNRLTEMDISMNCLTQLPNFSVVTPILKKLNASFNMLKQFPKLPPTIVSIDLSYNEIAKIPSNCKNLFPLLQTMIITNNQLISIPELPNSIEKIDLKNNFIEKVYPSLTPSLSEIDLSYNNLFAVPLFMKTKATKVKLSHNKILSLDPYFALGFLNEKSDAPIKPSNSPSNSMAQIENNSEPNLLILNDNDTLNQNDECNQNKGNLQLEKELNSSNESYSNNSNLSINSPTDEVTQSNTTQNEKVYTCDDPMAPFSKHTTFIDLHSNRLSEISQNILIKSLEELHISDNFISEIPADIKKCSSLRYFNISHNPISELPQQGFSHDLAFLFVSFCNLTSLPNSLRSSSIKTLVATNNNLQEIPKLSSVHALYLSSNKLTSFPFVPMSIKTLDLSNNQITDFPPQLLIAKSKTSNPNVFPSLEVFDISFNQITKMADFSGCPVLKILRVNDNPINSIADPSSFPSSLAILDISNTSITFSSQLKIKCEIYTHMNSNEIITPRRPRTNSMNLIDPPTPDPKRIKLSIFHRSPEKRLHQSHTKLTIPKETDQAVYKRVQQGGYIGYSEMRGIRKTMEDSIVVRSRIVDYFHSSLRLIHSSPILDQNTLNELSSSSSHLSNQPTNNQSILTNELHNQMPDNFNDQSLPPNEILTNEINNDSSMQINENLELNESSPLIHELDEKVDQGCQFAPTDLVCVFDGHGGCESSNWLSTNLPQTFEKGLELSETGLFQLIKDTSTALSKQNFADGSAAIIAILQGHLKEKLHLVNIGDSRAIVVTKKYRVKYSTVDHKPTTRSEFERVHASHGFIVNGRVGGYLAIPRSFGDKFIVGVTSKPSLIEIDIDVNEDRWLILGCDGIFNILSNERIAAATRSCDNADDLALYLRNLAFSFSSYDNISIIVVDLMKRRTSLSNDHQ